MSHVRSGFFSVSSGITADLLSKNKVNLKTWGTDKDIKDCLGEDLTIHPEQITKPGIYILAPVSLTEVIDTAALEAIKNHLTEALNAIKTNHVHGRISLLIPVNSDNNHWRLARIYIRHQKISSALLWDSLGGKSKILRTQAAFANYKAACAQVATKKIRISMRIAHIQHNSHSCMDYVLQKIYRIIKRKNPITSTNNEEMLRVAVIKQIAYNHPTLKAIADTLAITGNGFIAPMIHIHADDEVNIAVITHPETEKELAPIADVAQTTAYTDVAMDIHEELQAIFDLAPLAQETFDELYAKELQNLFNRDIEHREYSTDQALNAAYHQLVLWLSEEQHSYNEVTKSGYTNNRL